MRKYKIALEAIEIKYAVKRIENQIIDKSIDILEQDTIELLKESKEAIDSILYLAPKNDHI